MNEAIASICPARATCKLHRVACDVTCAGYNELSYQLKLSNIPQRFQTINGRPASLNAVTQLFADSGTPFAAFKASAKAVLDGGKQGLYLWSTSTGTGKSTAATALACEYLLRRVGQALKTGRASSTPYVYYINFPQFLEMVKRMYRDGNEDVMVEVGEIQERMAECDLLVCDDVAVTYASESIQERLLAIVEERYSKPTLYTSNCSLTQLDERLGARVTSRIYGTTSEVHLKGLDHRRRVGE